MVDIVSRMMVDRAISDKDPGVARVVTIMLLAEIRSAEHELKRLREVMPDVVGKAMDEMDGKNKE